MPQKSEPQLNLNTNSLILRKRKRKMTRKSVLKMLAVMEASQAAGPANKTTEPPPPVTPTPEQGSEKGVVLSHDDFLQSGRTGRRNALADIMGINAAVTSSDLPSRLESLTTKDKSETKVNEPGSSKS